MFSWAKTVFVSIINLEETELFITLTPNSIHYIIFGIKNFACFRTAMSTL